MRFSDIEDKKYRDILENEYKIIKTKKDKIIKNANIVYKQVTKYKNQVGLINRCCDLELLEEKANKYITPERLIAITKDR